MWMTVVNGGKSVLLTTRKIVDIIQIERQTRLHLTIPSVAPSLGTYGESGLPSSIHFEKYEGEGGFHI